MPLFDDSHVTDVGIQGSSGPVTGAWDFFKQSVEQQFRVDSQQALQEEIRNRWLENLQTFNSAQGTQYEEPPTLTAYTRYLDNIQGTEPGWFDDFDLETKAGVKRLEEADLAIRQSGGKSFSEIAQEVFAMQRETEQTTERMGARAGTGAQIAGFAGAAAGSFSFRDPINVISLPVGGGGRTIAMRIATEMAVGGAAVAATDVLGVMPNRTRAGLPERSLAYDVAAGAIGAGAIRGLFEGGSAAFRSLPSTKRAAAIRELEEFQFNQRDVALRAMLETLPQSPRARAGLAILDDTEALERANPYGSGPTAERRFYAELNEMQRSLGGASMTAVARVLPPIPIGVIDNALDLKLVREQVPEVWAKLEVAKAEVTRLDEVINSATDKIESASIIDAVRLVDEDAAAQLEQLSARVNDPELPEPERVAADIEAQALIQKIDQNKAVSALSGETQRTKHEIKRARSQRSEANRQYRAAYAEVEKQAAIIRKVEALRRGTAQHDAVDLLGYATGGRPFVGPMLRHDVVEARVAKIDEVNETIPDRTEALSKIVPNDEGMVEIPGIKGLVPADMRIPFDDGEMTIQQILNDFVEDDLLDEAMRSCPI